MPERELLILTALGVETQAVRAGLRKLPPLRDIRITQHTIGIAGRRTPAGLLAAWADQPPSCVVMAGFAGALDPSLHVGDVIIDPSPQNTCPGLPFRYGRIHTASAMVATPEAKAELFRQTGALAVEMETEPIRAAALAAGVPFVGIRAISDAADEGVDPAIVGLVDDLGRPRPVAMSVAVVRRPGLVRELARLGAASRRSGRALSVAVAEFVDWRRSAPDRGAKHPA